MAICVWSVPLEILLDQFDQKPPGTKTQRNIISGRTIQFKVSRLRESDSWY